MKINYSRHDDVYQELKKEENIIGWDKTQAAYEEKNYFPIEFLGVGFEQ